MRSTNHLIIDFDNNYKIVDTTWLSYLTKEKHSLSNLITLKLSSKKFNTKTTNYSKIFKKKEFTEANNIGYYLYITNILTNLKLNKNILYKTNYVYNLSNVNFIRKERLYTKLKYSRSPAYDIVSGGAAALLAGFIGFLISEKYGFELVDSGDFYYLFMYIVFLVFSLKPLLSLINYRKGLSQLLSLKIVFNFYSSLFYIILKKFR